MSFLQLSDDRFAQSSTPVLRPAQPFHLLSPGTRIAPPLARCQGRADLPQLGTDALDLCVVALPQVRGQVPPLHERGVGGLRVTAAGGVEDAEYVQCVTQGVLER
jgi:hypothetical protein